MPWKRIFLSVALLGAVLCAVWWLLPDALDVDVAPVQAGPMQMTVQEQGETRSHDRYVVSAPIAGRVMRIVLHEGDAVTENQQLALIAALPLSLRERHEAQARVLSAQALQRESERRLRQAEEALAQARREALRAGRLVQEEFLPPQAAEQAGKQLDTAALEVQAAGFRLQAAMADVGLVQAGLFAGSVVPVRSPVSGQVLRIHDPSERVVAAGTPLVTLGRLDHLEVVVELLSSEAVKVAAGMPVLLDGWGGDRVLRGTVRRIEPYAVTKVSALGIEEKRVTLVADFVDAPSPLGDGFRVNASIVIWEAAQVLKVPSSALFRCSGAWCVFVVEQGRARQRTVDIGQRNLMEAEVVRGLLAGQNVIVYPHNDMAEGVRVRLRSKP